jgi:hypothetical protein
MFLGLTFSACRIPLPSARQLALKYGLLPYVHTLLSSDPDAYLPPSLRRSPSPALSAGSSIESTGLVELDDSDSDDEKTRWRAEVPIRDSLAEKPYAWVKMSKEMVAGKFGMKGK